jgi:23S rRNA pseudouridine2605 synthase
VLSAVGTMIDEAQDVVLVDGVEAKPVEMLVYVVLNKPPNVMTTLKDPFRRKTVVSFLKKLPSRVYPVGRLDYDTEGVLILTNDGELAYRLAHPKFQIPKIYEARVKGQFKPADADKIGAGLVLSDGAVGKAQVDILGFVKTSTRIRLTLTEGRKHEVKQLCKLVGHQVEQLRRVEFAGIRASGLAIGEWRHLTPTELSRLRKAVGPT